MSCKNPEYTPLCNRHLRFYLSNPKRLDFQDEVSERQFRAVEQVMADAPARELELLKTVLLSPIRTRDLCDEYIHDVLRNLNFSAEEKEAFYQRLRAINKRIAILLGYIPGKKRTKQWITWTTNF